MILKSAHIQNFRSVCNAHINFGKQTAILGGNGVGKSTILKALEKFYGSSTQVELDDFFGRDARESIKIALTFIDFSDDELVRFASRIHNGEMTVVRIFEAKGGASGQYFGFTYKHEPFEDVRQTTGALDQRNAYKKLRDSSATYSALPNLTKAGDIEPALEQWENDHPSQCSLMLDNGRFFGFTNVANGALQKSTSFVFIPAVRDAYLDSVDGKGQSPIAKLMELVVRSAVQKREDIQAWQSRINLEYKELTDPENLQELKGLEDSLTSTLQSLYAESSVNLTWKAAKDFEVPLPTADVALEDGGFKSPVDRQGHGLQRAFIITLLQHLALAVSNSQQDDLAHPDNSVLPAVGAIPETKRQLPGLILAIEEPELYQHPSKQRHFASVLSKLTSGTVPGVALSTQVAFASHSPYFVSVDRFDEVRIARRHSLQGMDCKQCRVTDAQLEQVADRLEASFDEPKGTRNASGLRARLHIFDTNLAEGFFCEVVVLVEGISDRAAIYAAAATDGIDFEAAGVSVLAVGGKEKMPNAAAIFLSLGIPIYLIWDCDLKDGKEESSCNAALQRIAADDPRAKKAKPASDYVGERFAHFKTKLENVIVSELTTAVYNRHLSSAATEMGLAGRADAQKTPAVMTEIVARAAGEGSRSNTLSSIVAAINLLATQARTRT